MDEKILGIINGHEIKEYTFRNNHNVSFSVMNFGGIITKLDVPDKHGEIKDIALGFDELTGYEGDHPYFGALVGRYANRIAKGQFSINGKSYQLPINNAPNSLHGGDVGFDKLVYDVEVIADDHVSGVMLSGSSADGDQGYPGHVDLKVSYTLNEKSELSINYQATTDQPTIINLTNHSYFNLKGQGEGDVLDHEVTLLASRYTPVDESLIPTGTIELVAESPFDFRVSRIIGDRIDDQTNDQLKYGGGYDHNWVIDGEVGQLRLAAVVFEPESGRRLEVLTTEPGVQFYTGNFLDGSAGKASMQYHPRTGFCLETQHFPDSPNQPHFPSTILRPGEVYKSQTVYRFSHQSSNK